jgi:hypothetical protein
MPKAYDDIIKHLAFELRRQEILWDAYAISDRALRENRLRTMEAPNMSYMHPGVE